MDEQPGADIFAAIQAGDGDRLASLLRDGPARANARDPNGITPLLSAVYSGRRDLADLLIRGGADVDLFAAAALGRTARLDALLHESHALVHTHSADGWTPLHLAAFFGHPEAVRLLLARGASAQGVSQNTTGNTPFHSALASHDAGVATEPRRQIVQLLLAAGAEVELPDASGCTPLHLAAHDGDVELIGAFLARGADVNPRQDKGQTPLGVAIAAGHAEAAALLRRHGGSE
ncbi:MAG: ankyrin repeat domain-containing protein [bacterium]